MGLVAVRHVGSSSTQGSNWCPLHWQADALPLDHQGGPIVTLDQLNQKGGTQISVFSGSPDNSNMQPLPLSVIPTQFSAVSCLVLGSCLLKIELFDKFLKH